MKELCDFELYFSHTKNPSQKSSLLWENEWLLQDRCHFLAWGNALAPSQDPSSIIYGDTIEVTLQFRVSPILQKSSAGLGRNITTAYGYPYTIYQISASWGHPPASAQPPKFWPHSTGGQKFEVAKSAQNQNSISQPIPSDSKMGKNVEIGPKLTNFY